MKNGWMRAFAFGALISCGSVAAAADARPDVAAIINKAEAESILGEPVKPPSPRSMDGADGYYSKCTYYSATSRKSLVLRLHVPRGENVDPAAQFAAVTAGAQVKPVEGLADKAALLKGGAASAMPDNVVMLYLLKGNALVTIGIGGIGSESLATEKVKFVARKVLAHL